MEGRGSRSSRRAILAGGIEGESEGEVVVEKVVVEERENVNHDVLMAILNSARPHR